MHNITRHIISAGILTRLWAGWRGFHCHQGQRREFFSSPLHPDRL